MRQVRRILFVRTDRIGDVLMNLPALHLLRQTYPKAWITLLLDKSVAELLRNHPDLDEVMSVDSLKLKGNFFERRLVSKKIKKAGFDMAVVSNPDKFFHWALFACGIPCRVGYRRKWGFLLNKGMPVPAEGRNRHEIEKNLDLVRLVSDENWDGKVALPVDAQASSDVVGFLGGAFPANLPIIVFHTGTSDPAKRWPMEKYLALVQRAISKSDHQIVLIGGAEEIPYARALRARAGSAVVDWTGTLNLKQLAAFLGHEQVATLVTSDSGPMHIAWILGKPVVALFARNTRGSDPDRWGPRSPKSEIIYKNMDEITVEEVWECLERVLRR